MGRDHSPVHKSSSKNRSPRRRSSRERSRSPRRDKRSRSRDRDTLDRRDRDSDRRDQRDDRRDRKPSPPREREQNRNERHERKHRWDSPEAESKPKTRHFDPFSGVEHQNASSSKPDQMGDNEKVSKPSFEVSGKLAGDTNTFKGVVIKYNEPPEATKPRLKWRLYPMKGEEVLPPVYIHRQSAYLVGRDRKIADFPVDHPSCSKQHAVLQYRSMPFERNGAQGRRTLLYVIDLGSANGTYLNGERIEPQRYYELKEQDLIKFGFSQREYAVLHEFSAEGKGGEAVDEDIEEDTEIDREGADEKIKEEEDYF